jgi:hypothetical protein
MPFDGSAFARVETTPHVSGAPLHPRLLLLVALFAGFALPVGVWVVQASTTKPWPHTDICICMVRHTIAPDTSPPLRLKSWD